ncbi:MAG: hypothetical protein K2W99_07455 [Chthoniobacterales bacterium]|nr:hypothetical protein [Chthoniobacterales bacterium]
MNHLYRALITLSFLVLPIQGIAQSSGLGPRPGPPHPHRPPVPRPHIPGKAKVLTSQGIPKSILFKAPASSAAVSGEYYLNKKLIKKTD